MRCLSRVVMIDMMHLSGVVFGVWCGLYPLSAMRVDQCDQSLHTCRSREYYTPGKWIFEKRTIQLEIVCRLMVVVEHLMHCGQW